MEPWTFGEAPLPAVVELAEVLRDLTSTVLSLERTSPELEEADPASCATRRPGSPSSAPADPTPRVGDRRHRGPTGVRRPLARHRRVQPVLPASTRSRSTLDGSHGRRDGRVPGLLRGTARDRARRLPRGVLRLRAPAAQLRSRPGGQDGRALAPVPTADAAGHPARRARRAHHRGRAASTRRRELRARRHGALRGGDARRARGPRRAPGRVPPTRDEHPHHGQPRPARAGRRASRRRLRRLRRRPPHLRRRRTPQPGARARAAGGGRRSRQPDRPAVPDRPRLRRGVAGRRAHRRDRGADQHLLDRRSSCATCSPAPTSTCCSACPRTAATTTSPGCTTRWARTWRARRRRRCRSCGTSGWRRGSARWSGARRPGAGRGARRGRGRRHPGRPDGHRAHLGFDQRAEGRDPPARRAHPPPRAT